MYVTERGRRLLNLNKFIMKEKKNESERTR